MKNIYILLVFAAFLTACTQGGGGSKNKSFIIQPGDLTKFDSPDPDEFYGEGLTYSFQIDGTHSGNYAIVYNGIANGTDYVGIACSNDPDPINGTETYNLKIYFQADSIPSSSGIINGITIIEDDNGSINSYSNETITFTTFSSSSPIETDNYTYTVYHIEASGTAVGDLDIYAVHTEAN